MSTDTRLVQGRTGFHDWNNTMTCVHVQAPVDVAAAQLELLSSPAPVAPRTYQAVLSLTWGGKGAIAVRSESAATLEPITVSRPLPGPTPTTSVIWLEASPSVCSPGALHAVSQELLAALRNALAISQTMDLLSDIPVAR